MGRKQLNKKNHFINPYIRYSEQPDLCQKVRESYYILKEDKNIKKCHILTQLSSKYKMPRSTLSDWTKKWQIDEFWDPSDTSVHGDFHRIFTSEQEDEIYKFIYSNYISKNIYFSDKQFVSVAYEFFFKYYPNGEKLFECSEHFIRNFKKRHRISSRLAHYKRRKDIDNFPEDKLETIQLFTTQINSLIEYANQHDEPVINADETAWYILPNNILTWAETSSKSVQINVQDSDKYHITVMCSITSEFEKIPLFFIARGKTERSERNQIGDVGENEKTHSPKSFMTTNCFIKYLQFLRSRYPINKTIHLILDSYSSHKSVTSIQKAQDLNIILYFIPSGYTDLLQPLDISVFGPLKAMADAALKKYLFENLSNKIGMIKAVEILIDQWHKLSKEAISKGWDTYFDSPSSML